MESTQENAKLSRAQLFDLVWKEPNAEAGPAFRTFGRRSRKNLPQARRPDAAGHDTVAKLFGHQSWSAMQEVRDILEGLGYDVRNYGHAFY